MRKEIKKIAGVMRCAFPQGKQLCKDLTKIQTLYEGEWIPICIFHYDLLLMKNQVKQEMDLSSKRNKKGVVPY